MKKLLWLLMLMCSALLVAGCSSSTSVEDAVENSTTQALTTCTISGITGSSTFGSTVITGVRLSPNYGDGTRMLVKACNVADRFCTESEHKFTTMHWSSVNSTSWVGSKSFPLRRIVTQAPGCQTSAPDKWCMTLYGDNDVGDHVNLLQNSVRFLSDVGITIGSIEAPVGGAVAQFYGTSNYWRTKYTNAAGNAYDTQYWSFAMAYCP